MHSSLQQYTQEVASELERPKKKTLNKLKKAASLVLGYALDSFEVVEKRILNKLKAILDNKQHPLHELQVKQRHSFSRRLIQLCYRTEQYSRSFVPTAITLYNGIGITGTLFCTESI